MFEWQMTRTSEFLPIHRQSVNLLTDYIFFLFSCCFPGEIGGNMGLFLGCSLMTIFEFADLLVALVFVRALHKEYQT